jgi:hypothetical protein
LSPDNAAIFVCGLTGTIVATIVSMTDRAFVPDDHALRKALGVPPEIEDSSFFEHHDPQPVVDVTDAAVIEPLRRRMQAGLARTAARRCAPGVVRGLARREPARHRDGRGKVVE